MGASGDDADRPDARDRHRRRGGDGGGGPAPRPGRAVRRPPARRRRRVGRRRATARTESIEQPAKLLRIGSMVKQLLEEVRPAPLDEASRGRLPRDLRAVDPGAGRRPLPRSGGRARPDLHPLRRRHPCDAELRIAHAQLVGWLEACSTASRPRWWPSRWRPGPSSTRCASGAPPGGAPPPAARAPTSEPDRVRRVGAVPPAGRAMVGMTAL